LPAILTLPGNQDANFSVNVGGGQKKPICRRGQGDRRGQGQAGTGTGRDRDRQGQGQAGTGTGRQADRQAGGTGAKKRPPAINRGPCRGGEVQAAAASFITLKEWKRSSRAGISRTLRTVQMAATSADLSSAFKRTESAGRPISSASLLTSAEAAAAAAAVSRFAARAAAKAARVEEGTVLVFIL